MKIQRLIPTDPQTLSFCNEVEKTLLLYTIVMMREKQLLLSEAKALASAYLSLMPASNVEDLLQKIYLLSSKHRVTSFVYMDYGAPYFEEKRQKTLKNIRTYLKAGDINNAWFVAKGGGIHE